MALNLGDVVPDFTADSTEGKISFHEYLGNGWGVLFSHPKNFTPVCTTELGAVAKLKPEFDRRGVKVIGLSVDQLSNHGQWVDDIRDATGSTGRNFDEILRVIDSLQLTAKFSVATPVDWKHGDDVIIVPSVSDEAAKEKFPGGWKTVKPYLRVVAQPKVDETV